MSGSLAHAAPMRFLIGVMLVWTIGRGVAIAGWQPDGARPAAAPARPYRPTAAVRSRHLAWIADGAPLVPAFGVPRLLRPAMPPIAARSARSGNGVPRLPTWPARYDGVADRSPPMLAAYTPGRLRVYARSAGLVVAKSIAAVPRPSRFSGSAWAFFRGGGRATLLSPGGQIGGGQAGARILYTVDRPDRLALSARVSRTIGGIRQTEASTGLDWKPIASLPVHLMLERRFAIDKGGRNAWTLGTAGGVDDVHVAPGWRLDGYGEAGVVGAHRRDLYADGAARIARAIDLGGGRSLAVGGGAWGAAQPGASRLDLGPSVVLRAPVAGHFMAVALDWRERVVGDAKPGSGIALTIATDF